MLNMLGRITHTVVSDFCSECVGYSVMRVLNSFFQGNQLSSKKFSWEYQAAGSSDRIEKVW